MAQYDVHSLEGAGLVVNCQADLLDHLTTRVVIPLVDPATVPAPLTRLHPLFDIADKRLLMATHLIGAVPVAALGPAVASLPREHLTIIGALDVLTTGV